MRNGYVSEGTQANTPVSCQFPSQVGSCTSSRRAGGWATDGSPASGGVAPPQDVRPITTAIMNREHRLTVSLHSGTFMTRRGLGDE